MKQYIGLGKTLYNSSVCLITAKQDGIKDIEVALTERLTRKKANGAWPESPLKYLSNSFIADYYSMAESRDVILPEVKEEILDSSFPFYSYLEKKGFDKFVRKFNKSIDLIPHHLAHAYTALAMSPFNKSVIIVIDGAGSRFKDFEEIWTKDFNPNFDDAHEECTVYLQEGHELREVKKYWQRFIKGKNNPDQSFGEGIGILYEKIAEYIFASNQSAGKVMGLAPFGTAQPVKSYIDYQDSLDWSRAFKGGAKEEWENSPNYELYCDLAATAQYEFEKTLNLRLEWIAKNFPSYKNIIITGGCALNCSFNKKLIRHSHFNKSYVPPFPGDSGISFGLAHYMLYKKQPQFWKVREMRNQHGYYGTDESKILETAVLNLFSDFNINKPSCIFDLTSERLSNGDIIAWFQGRAESGPRALGNRSILASPLRKNLKNYLNENIKFRESFRPYGCSCHVDYARHYFDIPESFSNPYMSYAIDVKSAYKGILKEVSHVDGTSRMQIVTKGQNPRFLELIERFGEKTGIYCLANTSLNIMGEPIVETLQDALNFFKTTKVDAIVIGDFYVTRK